MSEKYDSKQASEQVYGVNCAVSVMCKCSEPPNDPSSPTAASNAKPTPEAESAVGCSGLLGDVIRRAKDAGRSASLAVKELDAALTRHVADSAVRPKGSAGSPQLTNKELINPTMPTQPNQSAV